MKSLRNLSVAALMALSVLLTTSTAWASRDATVVHLFNAASDQAEVLRYGNLDDYYTAYSHSLAAFYDLYDAWLNAPSGSYMQTYIRYAYQYQYSSQTYWYYCWLYGGSYFFYASYYSYLAQLYTAYAQYFAAFDL
jgi:hypothetical protein